MGYVSLLKITNFSEGFRVTVVVCVQMVILTGDFSKGKEHLFLSSCKSSLYILDMSALSDA